MVLEYGNAEKMCNLLKYLAESTVLTLDQINMVSVLNSPDAARHDTLLFFTHFLLLQGFHASFQRHD